MDFLKKTLVIWVLLAALLYAAIPNSQTSLSHIGGKSEKAEHSKATEHDRFFDNHNRAWQLFLLFLLLGAVIAIGYILIRQYNRQLKEQVQRQLDEIRQKDELLLQRQRMAAMGEMLSMISHQWRQPLGAITTTIMGIRIKLESGRFNLNSPTEQKIFLSYLDRKLNSVIEYVNTLSHTTDDFRNFFNPNKEKTVTNLSIPIENALEIIGQSLSKNGIKVIKEYKADPQLQMYDNEVTQVILNIFKNSEDNFTEKKLHERQIHIVTFARGKQYVILICDNGGGVPEEILPKIFEPYFSTKGKLGTGLGLYMSQLIMENHHSGTLKAYNRHNGVCFELLFNPGQDA